MKEINNANINYGMLTPYIEDDTVKHIIGYGKEVYLG